MTKRTNVEIPAYTDIKSAMNLVVKVGFHVTLLIKIIIPYIIIMMMIIKPPNANRMEAMNTVETVNVMGNAYNLIIPVTANVQLVPITVMTTVCQITITATANAKLGGNPVEVHEDTA